MKMNNNTGKFLVIKLEDGITVDTFGEYDDKNDALEALRILDFLFPQEDYELIENNK